MSWHGKNSLQDPLARVRGLGSAHEGAHHWWAQRVTAVALVFLGLWFVWFLKSLPLGGDAMALQFKAYALLQSPWHAAFLGAFVSVAAYHGFLGIQVIIEDYVHCGVAKWTTILLTKLVFGALALGGIVAILKMAL
ncbi:MAG: succinate dehydrogenase, hydrophobic membrane anchor protein [bacterium]|nr:succinate dehydrogenase, hydrophobic membrane anchor protein [bacterium]